LTTTTNGEVQLWSSQFSVETFLSRTKSGCHFSACCRCWTLFQY
jgi:hypothetical protein